MVNLCANDGQRVFDVLIYLPHVLCCPVLAVTVVLCTYYLVGPAALLGTTVYVAFYPLQVGRAPSRGGAPIERCEMPPFALSASLLALY